GQPVPSDEFSARLGELGPQPIHDFYLIEKLAHFNRENVPERLPHAKGSGAFGEFVTTEDVSDITCAGLFQQGVTTPM
ncbi:catalase, partial [Mycobacterium tuberculosis]|nr:catalase [Mycobacterium tuberculosis]